MIPKIETDRLLLILPSAECFHAYEAFYTDGNASKAYGGPISRCKAWARLQEDISSWYLNGSGVWAMKEKISANVVGVFGMWQSTGSPTELTWWLLPGYQGKGYVEEASIAVIDHAFGKFGWGHVENNKQNLNESAGDFFNRFGQDQSTSSETSDASSHESVTLPKSK